MLKTFSSTWIGAENNMLATKLKKNFFILQKLKEPFHTLFLDKIQVFVLLKVKECFENQGLLTEVKNYLN